MRFLLIAALALAGCGGASKAPAKPTGPEKTLFERLGGQPAINAVVHAFVMMTGDDKRISMFFTNVDKPKLEAAMDDHVCFLTGGGCQYKGKTMLEAHTNMKLQTKDFDAFMDDLAKVLANAKVPERETKEVIAAFQSLEADVVGH